MRSFRASAAPALALALASSVAGLAGCSLPRLLVLDDDAGPADADASTDVRAPDAQDVPLVTTGDVARIGEPTPSCPAPAERGCARVLVRGGSFTLGSVAAPDQGPVQPGITVDDFVIDATEVTVARYRRFADYLATLRDADAGAPAFRAVYPDGVTTQLVTLAQVTGARIDPAACTFTAAPTPALDEHPIDCVDWYTAQAFCVWDGARLPTEAEYEYTARYWNSAAPAGRLYPWSDESPVGRCDLAQWNSPTCRGTDSDRTVRVGVLVDGQRDGVFDLAGNVAEWLADAWARYASTALPNDCWGRGPQRNPVCNTPRGTERGFRGGSAHTDAAAFDVLQTYHRGSDPPDSLSPSHGMRCVRPALP